jgi:hypothetical protein
MFTGVLDKQPVFVTCQTNKAFGCAQQLTFQLNIFSFCLIFKVVDYSRNVFFNTFPVFLYNYSVENTKWVYRLLYSIFIVWYYWEAN